MLFAGVANCQQWMELEHFFKGMSSSFLSRFFAELGGERGRDLPSVLLSPQRGLICSSNYISSALAEACQGRSRGNVLNRAFCAVRVAAQQRRKAGRR